VRAVSSAWKNILHEEEKDFKVQVRGTASRTELPIWREVGKDEGADPRKKRVGQRAAVSP